uniref:F-box protein n=1 Tax=Noccaea caerulescens TaxID=107243 RepID=A0A1J3H8E6_NOCCA
MCVLDNHLCVSQKNWSTQVIWWFHSSSGTWNHLCSIDLTNTFSWFRGESRFVLPPVAILDKNKLLLRGGSTEHPVVVYDLDTKFCDLLFIPTNPLGTVTYFESLLSVL